MITSIKLQASRMIMTFAITFALSSAILIFAYKYPNLPVIFVKSAIYGILMAICRMRDSQPRLQAKDILWLIATTLLLWVTISYFFITELPIRPNYALFWAFAYSSLVSGFQLFVNRSLSQSKYKLILSPFIVGGLSTIPIILAGISYALDLSAKGTEIKIGISQLVLFLPPVIAICSACIIFLESNSFFARKK